MGESNLHSRDDFPLPTDPMTATSSPFPTFTLTLLKTGGKSWLHENDASWMSTATFSSPVSFPTAWERMCLLNLDLLQSYHDIFTAIRPAEAVIQSALTVLKLLSRDKL